MKVPNSFHTLDPIARANLESLSKSMGVSKSECINTLTSLFFSLTMQEKGTVSSDGLQDNEFSEEMSSSLEETVGKVPAIATLVREPVNLIESIESSIHHDYLSISDFSRLPLDKALESINLICHSGRSPSKDQISGIYNFFSKSPENFDKFLGFGTLNAQFDAFLSAIEPDLRDRNPSLNSYKNLMSKLMEVGFSDERFNAILIQNDDINADLINELLKYESALKKNDIFAKIETIKNDQLWLKLNMEGSSSVADINAKKRWIEANELKTRCAKNGCLQLDDIFLIHRKLTRGEEGVDHPGQLRCGIVRIAGGGATALPPPPTLLDSMMLDYEDWMRNEISKCREGEKSIILTAAQSYQRLVTIHPFENGNGRVSRLVMNYVLESSGLPSAILGDKVLDAVFSLKPRKSQSEQEVFVNKIYQGVKKSAQFINVK